MVTSSKKDKAALGGDNNANQAPPKRRKFLSPLTRRVLAVNLLAPLVLVVGLLYMGDYKQTLYERETAALQVQAELIATAFAEGAVWPATDFNARKNELLGQSVGSHGIAQTPALEIMRRSLRTVRVRARLFDANGLMVLDGRHLKGRGLIQVEDLPPPAAPSFFSSGLRGIYDEAERFLKPDQDLPFYMENATQSADDYEEVYSALNGDVASQIRRLPDAGRLLSVAVPIQYYKEVVGAIMLSRDSEAIEENLYTVRLTILKLFVFGMAVTVVLSLYMAGTITGPLVRLAAAAERIRSGAGRQPVGPGLTHRRDEIGALATSLTEMTEALWDRMDAIESFAADVSHEIKNPLTSLKSAVETAARIKDKDQLQKLMNIILQDTERLDRLITDISDASRLDAELSRAEMKPVDLRAMLEALAEVHKATNGVALALNLEEGSGLTVRGREGRIVQVFHNLIGNAATFSPDGSTITLHAWVKNGWVQVDVEDEGPGLPEGTEKAVFQRFYTERPESEEFGMHSGLGLSISKQIIDAYHGSLVAENRMDDKGRVLGARFTVRLPVG